MLDVLTTLYNISRERMGIAGYADTIPVDSNDTEEGRAHNRRVDIVILNQQVVTKDSRAAEPTPSAPPPHKK
jgi:chemotaxis protein MotB